MLIANFLSMKYSKEQVRELKNEFPCTTICMEGERGLFLIPNLEMPKGCKPKKVIALLDPEPLDGYKSTLYFEQMIDGGPDGLNWNKKSIRLVDKSWFAISWQTPSDFTLIEMVHSHLSAFQKVIKK
jgi:hypothetical protein